MTEHARSLTHLVRQPIRREESAPPLLLLLHGVGSNETDLFTLAPEFDPRFFVVSARAPLTLGYGSYAWFHVAFTPTEFIANTDELEASRQLLTEFIPELVAAYDLDPQRVYLLGFSQGAIMSLAVALTRPELVAGVVALSGRLAPEALARRASDEALRGLPILLMHGTWDEVLPIHHGHDARDRLAGLPVELTYREYPIPHTISAESFADADAWLRARLDHDAEAARQTPPGG